MLDRTTSDAPAVVSFGDFALGDWVIQPMLNRASRNGSTIHLRPQLVDVLVCLNRNAGQTVAREDLLDRVWPNQFVVDTALARCVAELRQALGDNAQTPVLIETIPKRGYRLIAPVSRLTTAEDDDHGAGGNGHGPGTGGSDDGNGMADWRLATGGNAGTPGAGPGRTSPVTDGPDDSAAPARPNNGEADAAVTAGPGSATAQPRAAATDPEAMTDSTRTSGPRAPRRIRWRPLLLVLTAAAITGSLMTLAALRDPAAAKPLLAERDPVVVTFTNATNDPLFDGTLRLALAIHLEQSPYLRLTSERTVQETLGLLGQPAATVTPALALQVCERLGASAVLHGSITPMGRRFVLGLEALSCVSHEPIARAQTEAASREHVLEALASAANSLRRTLGESLSSVARFDVPLAQATTPSLEALRVVSLGDRETYRGNYPEALAHYRRATTMDAEFAVAWARLGVTLLNLRRPGAAVAPLTRAYELRERVSEPERLYITGHYHNGVTGDPLLSIDAFSALAQTAARGLPARINLSTLYQQIGLWEEAADTAQSALPLERDSVVTHVVLAGALTGLGRFDEAVSILSEASRRGLESPSTHDLRYDLAFIMGDTAVMQAENTYAAGQPAMTPFLLIRQARLAMYRGQFRAASALWERVRADAASRDDHATASMALLADAGSRALAGDRAGTRQALAQALELDRSASRLAEAARVLALAGDVAGAHRYLAEYDRLVPDRAVGRDMEYVAPAQAALAVAERRYDEVPALLEPIRPYELGTRFEYLPLFLRAHAAMGAGQYEASATAFRTILDRPGIMPFSVFHPYARLGYARAHAKMGNRADSVREYEHVLRLWQHADPGLSHVSAARRELAALRSN